MLKKYNNHPALLILLSLSAIIALPSFLFAHCDTMDGPVVTDAKTALAKADITPVLKWVQPEFEAEIREVFAKTLVVRKQSKEAQELADMYFFETLVRLHRAGEGAPYTGLKPAGTDMDPAVVQADKALETGSIDGFIEKIKAAVDEGIHSRFLNALEKKKHAVDSVEAGREYVEAYIQFVHYVENLHLSLKAHSAHHNE